MICRAAPFALGLYTLALLPLVPGAARAQATPEGAKALEQQIHDWITGTLGPDVKIAQRPIQVTAAADHYDLKVPVGNGADAPNWTATARERSGGRYAIDDIHFPSPSEFHVKLPDSVTQGGPPGMTGDITYKIAIGTQSGQMLVDPSFATSTTATSAAKNIDLQSSGGMAPTTSHVASGSSSVIVQPGTSGRLDIAIESNLDDYSIASEVPNAGPFKLSFGKTHVMANATSLSRQRAVQVLQAAIKVGKAMAPQGDAVGDAKPDAAGPDFAAAMLEAIADLATGASIDETIQDLGLNVGGMAGSLHGLQIGFGIKGAGGLLQARMDLGADGLVLPDLGLGAMAELIPTKISLRPTVSGVPADALMALGKASSAGDDPSPDDIMALFAKGPITAGLESLTVDVAGAEFSGLGKLAVASPQEISGTAQITATNLDLLQQKIAGQPSLAQAGPAIIFLKGVGRSVGNQMIWDISYNGGRLLVNNQDLSAMMGGGGGPAAQQTPPPAPPRPAPPSAQQFPPAPGPQGGQPQLRRRP